MDRNTPDVPNKKSIVVPLAIASTVISIASFAIPAIGPASVFAIDSISLGFGLSALWFAFAIGSLFLFGRLGLWVLLGAPFALAFPMLMYMAFWTHRGPLDGVW